MKLAQVKTVFRHYAAACLAVGLLFLAGPAPPALASPPRAQFVVGRASYTVAGQVQSMAAATFQENNRTYVPVRYLALALGVPENNIIWNNAAASVTLSKGGLTVKLMPGSRNMQVNGRTVTMDAAPVSRNGRVYLPARYVAEAFGYRVGWDETGRTVSIFAPENITAGGRVTVSGDVVNVRGGPGTGYTVVAQATRGQVLSVQGKSGDWVRVQLPGGKTGWIASWLVADASSATGGTDPSGGAGGSAPAGADPQQPGTGNGGQTGSGSTNTGQPAGGAENSGQSTGQSGGGAGSGGQTSPPGQSGGNNGGTVNPADPLTGLQVSQQGDNTVVTVSAATPMSYHDFRLTGPDRLVIDLTGVQPGGQPSTINVNSTTVQDVRVGYYSKNPDVTRLVFDLKQYVSYQITPGGDQKTLTITIAELHGVLSGTSIAVDAGHGGSDPGAIGPDGLDEKNVNLAVARRVAELLEQQGARVVLTRSDDSYVGLDERTQIANQAGTDLFVSIHMNASTDSSYNGTATYYLSQAGVDDAVYYGLAGRAAEDERRQVSSELASCIQSELVSSLGLKDDGTRQANFAVLRTSLMPAVLVEVAFISNPWEESQMTTDQFVENAAQGIVRGIADFLARHPVRQ